MTRPTPHTPFAKVPRMTALTHLRPAVAVGALLAGLGAASGAMAAVTPQDVWADTKAWLTLNSSATITTASESEAGGVLTVSGIEVVTTDDTSGTVTSTIDQITFTDQGDGTVAIAYGTTTNTTVPPEGVDMPGQTMTATYEDAVMTASGDPGAITYTTTAARQIFQTAQADGTSDVTMTLADVNSTWVSSGTDVKTAEGTMTAAGLSVDGTVNDAEAGMVGTLSGKVADISLAGTGTIPLGIGADPSAMLAAGLSVDGTASAGAGQFVYAGEATADSPATNVTVSMTGAEGGLVINTETMAVNETISGVGVQVTGQAMPIDVSMGAATIALSVPVSAGDAPQPWSTKTEITDLTLGEEIWAMFDPGEQLPRDPASLTIDLAGTATLTQNLTDAAAMEEAAAAGENPAPGQVNSADINALRLAVLGAELTGTGSFTFNNDDLVTFGGIPAPTGTATFNLTGINALMDKLVAAGLVPQEQLMGAQMMIGMFAKPNGDDAFTSEVEVSGDGQVLVNGQRMR